MTQKQRKKITPEVGDAPLTRHFDDDTIVGLRDLGDILMGIRQRLLAEGYIIKDGKYVPPDAK
jgi:hypothetical protein